MHRTVTAGFGFALLASGVLQGFAPGSVSASGAAVDEGENDPRVDFLQQDGKLSREAAEAQQRFLDRWEAKTIELADRYSEHWAGAWVDHDEQGIVHIAVTDPAVKEEIEQAYGDATVLLVRNTAAQLSAVHEPLIAAFTEELPGVPYSVVTDIQSNSVRLEYASEDSAEEPTASSNRGTRAQGVAESVGRREDVRVVDVPVEGLSPPTLTACSRASCDPPLRGGIEVNMSMGDCTLGFLFTAGSTAYASTAAHCDGLWGPKHHDGRLIGDVVGGCWCNKTDAWIISIQDPKYWAPDNSIYRPGNTNTQVTSKIQVPAASLEGIVLCSSGRVGQERCGPLTDYDVSGNGINHAGRFNPSSNVCQGDSGGPVFNQSTSRAYGLNHAADTPCNSSGESYFSWTAYIEQQTGYQLKLS